MSNQVKWTSYVTETFLTESGILDRAKNGDDKAIILEHVMRARINGISVVQTADMLSLSVSSVNRYVRELKDLYDATQINCPSLPVRKNLTKWEKEEAERDGKF